MIAKNRIAARVREIAKRIISIEADSEEEAAEIAIRRSQYNTSPDRVSLFEVEEAV